MVFALKMLGLKDYRNRLSITEDYSFLCELEVFGNLEFGLLSEYLFLVLSKYTLSRKPKLLILVVLPSL